MRIDQAFMEKMAWCEVPQHQFSSIQCRRDSQYRKSGFWMTGLMGLWQMSLLMSRPPALPGASACQSGRNATTGLRRKQNSTTSDLSRTISVDSDLSDGPKGTEVSLGRAILRKAIVASIDQRIWRKHAKGFACRWIVIVNFATSTH